MPENTNPDPVASALKPIGPALPMLSERFQPRNLTELMSWAKLVTSSGLAPKGMNEAAVVLCAQMGAELGISTAQSLQNIAVINGRPSIFGDVGLAIFRRDAAYKTFEEDAPDTALKQGFGRCRIEMRDGRVVERRFSTDEAKAAFVWSTDGKRIPLWEKPGPWQQFPGRMLMWRARWWAMRDAAPEVFKGVSAREEMEDVTDLGRVPAETVERPKARPEFQQLEKFAAEAAGKPKAAEAPKPPADPTPQTTKTASEKPRNGDTIIAALQSIETETGKKKNGEPWTKYIFVLSDGQRLGCWSKTAADQARGMIGTLPVEITTEAKGEYVNVTAIRPYIEAAPAKTESAPTRQPGDDEQEAPSKEGLF